MSAQTARRACVDVASFWGIAAIVTAALATSYTVLHLVPYPAFAYSIREERFTLYSDWPIGADEHQELVEGARRIEQCEFDDPRIRHQVFLCHDAERFVLFAWPLQKALGITNA